MMTYKVLDFIFSAHPIKNWLWQFLYWHLFSSANFRLNSKISHLNKTNQQQLPHRTDTGKLVYSYVDNCSKLFNSYWVLWVTKLWCSQLHFKVTYNTIFRGKGEAWKCRQYVSPKCRQYVFPKCRQYVSPKCFTHLSHYNYELHPKIEQNKIPKSYTCSLIVLNGNRAWCSSMVLSVASDKKNYHFTIYLYCWNMLKMNVLCYRKWSRHVWIRIVVSSMNFF
jgi:hypothetical protein